MSTNIQERSTYSARLSTKGQIVLPKMIREMFNLDAGDMIDFSVVKKSPQKKEIVLKKGMSMMDLVESGHFPQPRKNKGVSPLEARKYMEENYERN